MKKFEIYIADLRPTYGAQMGGVRYIVILQSVFLSDMETVICAPITTGCANDALSIEIKMLNNETTSLNLGQIRTIDKKRIRDKYGELFEGDIEKVQEKIMEIFGLK